MSFVKHAVDRQKVTIEDHLRRLGIDFELRYQVESFTFSRSLAEVGLCWAVLPNRLGSAIPSLERIERRGKPIEFGEHRVCASYRSEDARNPRMKSVLHVLKSALQ